MKIQNLIDQKQALKTASGVVLKEIRREKEAYFDERRGIVGKPIIDNEPRHEKEKRYTRMILGEDLFSEPKHKPAKFI